MPQAPDIPTVAEQGFPGYQVDSWWGIVAPRGVPKPILDRLQSALAGMYTAPDVREQLARLGMTVRASTPQEFDRHLRDEMALWGKVVRESGLSATQ
jgi:tripartite-type tricarboxylate transporter receptor subunit TctC